jgi:hypothetical protein
MGGEMPAPGDPVEREDATGRAAERGLDDHTIGEVLPRDVGRVVPLSVLLGDVDVVRPDEVVDPELPLGDDARHPGAELLLVLADASGGEEVTLEGRGLGPPLAHVGQPGLESRDATVAPGDRRKPADE